jgi:hypothetical protein
MSLQLIVVVEANAKSQSDFVYVSALLKCRYALAHSVRITPVYLGGKGNYSRKEAEINKWKRKYKFGPSRVVFVLDTDFGKTGAGLNPDIEQYCKRNGYDLVWMNRDIEEVFLGRCCSNKTEEAERFARQNRIKDVDLEKLGKRDPTSQKGTSNLLLVFDALLSAFLPQ